MLFRVWCPWYTTTFYAYLSTPLTPLLTYSPPYFTTTFYAYYSTAFTPLLRASDPWPKPISVLATSVTNSIPVRYETSVPTVSGNRVSLVVC